MSNADKVKQLEAENEKLKKQLDDTNFLLGQYMNQKVQLEQQLMLMNKEMAQQDNAQVPQVVEGETVN
jgi:predicted  nucleic acid-binding Zn-ribbon protein